MSTSVSLKPNATKVGESDYTKTVAANAYTALNDGLDTTWVTRASTTSPASLRLAFDLSVVPAGKTLNRWRIKCRNDRDTSKSKWHARVEWLTSTGGLVTTWGSQFSRSGVLAGPADDFSGWNGARLSNFLDGYGSYLPGIGLVDDCTASGDRTKFYELWVECEFLDPPTVSSVGPTGTVTDTNYPTISWTFTSAEGNPQAGVTVKIFDSATYGGGGFDPATSLAVWTGVGAGSGTSWQVDEPLPSGTYRAYVRAEEDTGWATNFSAWAFSTFTISISPPALPTVTAGYDEATNKTTVVVQGHTNLLTAEQANLEGGTTTGWAVGTNCAIANSGTVSGKVGTKALRLTSSAGGDMYATTTTGTGGIPVIAGEVFTAVASFRTGASARSCRVDIAWYDSGGSLLSTSSGIAGTDATNWTSADLQVIATAPANAAFAAVRVYVLATGGASELHYVDCIALYPGISSASVNLAANPSAEVNVSGWIAAFSSPVTITRSTARATHGSASFLMTSTSNVTGNAGFFAVGLTPGAWYTIAADFYITTADGCPSVALATIDATVNSSASTTTKDGWVRLSITIQAASTSHFIFVAGLFTASGQKFWVDSVQVEAGTVATAFSVPTSAWSVGGFTSHSIRLERSNDGGATWTQVRKSTIDTVLNDGISVTTPLERYTVIDYEAARPGLVLYRARDTATLSTVTASSDWTANYQLTTTSDGQAWLKAVAAPNLNAAVRVRRGSFDAQVEEDSAVFRPLGRAGRAVVVSGDLGGKDGQLTVLTTTPQELDTAYALLTHQGVLLLQDVKVDSDGRGYQRWIRCIGTRTITRADNPAVEDLTASFVYVGPD